MESALQLVSWETCLLEPVPDRELEAYARRKFGMPYPLIRYFTAVPWVAHAMLDLHPEFGLLTRIDQQMSDLVSMVVSQGNSCRFCYAAFRMLLWSQGMSPARIQKIEFDLSRADLEPRTLAAIAFGRSQSRNGPAGAREARRSLLEAGFDEGELREVAYAAGATDFSNRLHTIPAIPATPIERMPQQWHMRLMRPLIGRLLARARFRGAPQPPPEPPSHPYGRLVMAFAGSPIAPAFARTFDEMWSSPLLPRRAKLLMFAIVARGLDCRLFNDELRQALIDEGLPGAAQDQVLTHLDAPQLDTLERMIVPFARETIWYEPAAVQRRARSLRERLPAAQCLEAIGVSSLANWVCRMSASVLPETRAIADA